MIWWIARRELLEHVRSSRFVSLSLLAVLMLPATAYVGVSRFRDRERFAQELDDASALATETVPGDGNNGASRFGWRSGAVQQDPALRAIRHPRAEEVFADGRSGAMPVYWQFSTEGSAEGPPASAGEQRTLGADSLDVAIVIETVLGLLALLVAFDAMSGELETGRMRTILAHPVSRAAVLVGKFVGAIITLSLPLCVGMGAAYGVFWLRDMPALEARFVATACAVVLIALLYLGAMLALGMAVSALTRESRTSLVTLLVIWIGISVAVPRGAMLIAATVRPIEPVELMRASIRQHIAHLERERARQLASAWEEVSGTRDVPADGSIAPDVRAAYSLRQHAIEQRLAIRKRQIIGDLQDARERDRAEQVALATTLGRLSPSVVMRLAVSAVASTGRDEEDLWREEVKREQRALEGATFDQTHGMELFASNLGFLRMTFWPDNSDVADRVPDYRALPVLVHQRDGLAAATTRMVPEAAILALESVSFITIAGLAFSRLDA